MPNLFDPLSVGDLSLAHRLVMAPLTRCRAPGTVPTKLMAAYYAQRADPATGAALIISEATQVDPFGQGYLDTPGLHSDAQVAGWKRVTQAVHDRGGLIAAQLWHVGRISHRSMLPGAAPPVSCGSRASGTKTLTAQGFEFCSEPRALANEEMPKVVDQFRQAAKRAMDAGFDAVEVHAANGYLIDQFLRDSINDRQDAYGGGIAQRCRFLFEVINAVSQAVGPGRTGVRLSPVTLSNGAPVDSDPQALYRHVIEGLAAAKLAYVHVVEGQTGGAREGVPFDYAALQARFAGAWMVNNGYTGEMAQEAVSQSRADLVAMGRPFIANPDLSRRLRIGAQIQEPDRSLFYGGGAAGYTDYPALPA